MDIVTFITIAVSWGFGAAFIVGGTWAITDGRALAGLIMAAAGVLMLPPVAERVQDRVGRKLGLWYVLVLVALALALMLFLTPSKPDTPAPGDLPATASSDATLPDEEPEGPHVISIDVCTADPDNADEWRANGVPILDEPLGETVFTLPACDGVEAEVIGIRKVQDDEYVLIRLETRTGWQLADLLTIREE